MHNRAVSIFLTTALVSANAAPASAVSRFSMEQILSAPFVDDLTTSPDGTTLAFAAHERGARNVYFARVGQTAHKVTPYTADDGETISAIAISPDNKTIAYVRGEGTNDRGEYPNPLSLPVPPKQTVYVISTHDGAPQRVAEGHSPVIAPRGDRILWIWRGQPYIAAFTSISARAGKAQRLFSIRGALSDPQFSPDGNRAMFVNSRGDHTFIVLFDIRARRITYATPNFAHDGAPIWSPDGRSIAFIRSAGTLENEDPYQHSVKEPWALWLADAQTGDAHKIWQADPGMGSDYYGTDSRQQLFWSRENRIVFPWEKDGWRHLYAVSVNGGTAQILTPGQFEVETAVQSADRTQLIFSSNQGDIDRRHIWSVSADSSTPAQLTSGTKDQWAPEPLPNGAFAYVQAGYNDPPVAIVQRNGQSQAVGGPAVPAEFPANDLIDPQLITFLAPDGLTIHGQLFVPQDASAKHCAIIFDHGGSRRQMLPGFHYMEAYTNLYESNQYYVNHGCVVLSINYRSGIMYGHDFRQPKNYGAEGASEYQDVLAGAHYLQNRADVDPARIGIYGLSYGGYLTALGLARNSDIFKAGVDMAGVHNWAFTRDSDYGRAVGTPEERKIAFDASPVASIDTWRSPVFMSQGDDDRNVDFSEGVDLATRLRAKGVEVVEMVFPNETHENITFADMLRLYDTSSNWLLRKLGAQ